MKRLKFNLDGWVHFRNTYPANPNYIVQCGEQTIAEITRSEDDEKFAKLIVSSPKLFDALIACRKVLRKYNSTESINAWYVADQLIQDIEKTINE